MSKMAEPLVKRLRLSRDDLESLSKEELISKWSAQEMYLDTLEARQRDGETNDELVSLRESEEKLKQQQIEATRKENVLVMRLTTKEQEMQDYANRIQELKQAQNPNTAQLRTMLLDPAINLMFQKMKKEMEASKEKLEQAQNDLSAWKFTPDSHTGKRLMAKCRMLLQENEELGKVISSGRTAKLEGDIALEKTLVQEMKKSQAEIDEFLVELDEDVDGMQSTIYMLQQQLKDSKDQLAKVQSENEQLRTQHQQQQQQQQQQQLRSGSLTDSLKKEPNRTSYPSTTSVKTETKMEVDDSEPIYRHSYHRNHLSETSNGDRNSVERNSTHGSTGRHLTGDHERHQTTSTSTTQIRSEVNHSTVNSYEASDSAGPMDSTDASSEAWSPQSLKHSSGAVEEDSDSYGQSTVSDPSTVNRKSGASNETFNQNGMLDAPEEVSEEDDDDEEEEEEEGDDEEEEEEDGDDDEA